MFLCIRLEEKDLFWILTTWNLKFLIQAEQKAALLWKNYTFQLLENSWPSRVIPQSSSEWSLLKVPQQKNMYKVNGK